jgi:hypothetical protein
MMAGVADEFNGVDEAFCGCCDQPIIAKRLLH